MFTIKIYDHGSQSYTAFSTEMYRREFVRYRGPDDTYPLDRLVIWQSEGEMKNVEVHGAAFVENDAGKTIDRIGCVCPIGPASVQAPN